MASASTHRQAWRAGWVSVVLAAATAGIAAIVLVTQTPTSTAAEGPQAAGKTPSRLATMVCAPKAVGEIDQIVEQDATVAEKTWLDHRYSCDYRFKLGTMVLSVKELSSWSQTVGYFRSLDTRLGRRQTLYGLGQGAFMTRNGSVVVRKDWKVLLVDTSELPGEASIGIGNISLDVAAAIMGCWHGD